MNDTLEAPDRAETTSALPAGAAAQQPPPDPVASWRVQTEQGLSLHVAPRLDSITTYVLLEQHRWFEDEVAFLPRLVPQGGRMLDVGAHLGVYALSVAQARPDVQVVAFEPAAQAFELLARSVVENHLAERVSLARVALADEAGPRWLANAAQAELKRLVAPGAAVGADAEAVAASPLDAFVDRNLRGQTIDLIKIDVQGDEAGVLRGAQHLLQQGSPVVQFAVDSQGQAGEAGACLQAWGYALYRLLPALGVLVPLGLHPNGAQDALNLFGLKPDTAARLAAQGLAVPADAHNVAPPAEALPTLEAVAAVLHRLADPQAYPADADGASQRVRDARAAFEASRTLGLHTRDVGAITTVIHAHALVGLRAQAAELCGRLLQQWPGEEAITDGDGPWLSPQGEALAMQPRREPAELSRWLRLQCEVFRETERSWSSFFAPADPFTLRRLLRQENHPVFLERRFVLGEFRQNRSPDLSLVQNLRQQDGCNAAMWRAVLDAPI